MFVKFLHSLYVFIIISFSLIDWNVKVKLKDNIGAMYDFSKAIELDSNYINPYINRGVLKSKMGDYNGELSDYLLA